MRLSIKPVCVVSVILMLMFVTSCNVGYKNDGKEVTWRTWNEGSGYGSQKIDADPKTFEKLDDDYGRDMKHAFYKGDIVKGADGGSFRAIGKGYAADKSHVYFLGKSVEKADPATFKVYSYYFAEDAKDLFWNGEALNVRDKSTIRPV